jgi:N-acetylmuramoyl-L-alanine amidase
MKLGIIVGHTRADEGAFSRTLNQQEYSWNSDLANMILAVNSGVERRVFFRDNGGIDGAYGASDQWGSNITVELHFNSAHLSTATGTGVLYLSGSTRGKRFATHLFERTNAVLRLGDWPKQTGGVVTPFQASGQQMRGQRSLTAGRAPATLIEPFFGSNPNDCNTASANKSKYAEAIVRAAEDWFA